MTEETNELDLFDSINLARDKYISSQEKQKNIYEEMNEEILESTKKIKLSYQERIDILQKDFITLKSELEKYKKLLECYSTFDSKMIGNIIEKLVTLVEGEEYSYQKANHRTYEYETTVFGSELFQVNKKLLIIVKGNSKCGNYYDDNEQNNEIYKLIKSGQAFVLSKSELTFDEKIRFYSVNKGRIKCLIDFSKFSYVKDFIDLIIQHRFKNNLKEISEKELLSIFNEFILSKKEMIEENYKKRILERQEQLEKQLIEIREKEEKQRKIEFENILQNSIPNRFSNNLIDRLRESINLNTDMNQFEIMYESKKHTAKIIYSEPLISSKEIFIAKIDIKSVIKDYFDDSDPDPHFHGYCDIELLDDGLIGIVDISGLEIDDFYLSNNLYRIDKINDKYLRILYLPNKGNYRHKPINIYNWIMEGILSKKNENSKEKATSYITEWNATEETEKMLSYLKETELISSLDEKELKLYKY